MSLPKLSKTVLCSVTLVVVERVGVEAAAGVLLEEETKGSDLVLHEDVVERKEELDDRLAVSNLLPLVEETVNDRSAILDKGTV